MDPFTSKGVFDLKEISSPAEFVWHGFKLEAEPQSESLHLAQVEEVQIPELKSELLRLSIHDESHDRLDLSTSTSSRTESDGNSHLEQDPGHDSETDIWDVTDLSRRQPKHGLLNWDHFNGNDTNDSAQRYLSEAGEAAYDAVISRGWLMGNREVLRYARLDHFKQAVLNVLLGRSSLIFEWNDFTLSFETQLHNVTLVGHSTQLMTMLCKGFCACGTSFRNIQTFCQSHKPTTPSTFAVQNSLLQILNAIETDLLQEATVQSTIVRLQDISSKNAEMYETLQPIVVAAQSPGKEPYVLATVIRYIAELWSSDTSLRPVLTDLADRILQPSIRDTYEQIGMGTKAPGATKNSEWVFADLLPNFEPMFQDILKCIQVGNNNGVRIRRFPNSATTLQLAHRWLDTVEAQYQADLLELESRKNLENPYPDSETTTKQCVHSKDVYSSDQDPFDINFQTAPSNFVDLQQCGETDARLSRLVLARFRAEEMRSPPELSPVQMLEMSLEPIMSAQHRRYSYALMRCLFLQHDLVAHLGLLHAHQLFGNGYFVTRLSRALFDTGQNSAEGRRKTGLTAGLRLEDREIWPPASSELRFVLMGLLSESANVNEPRSMLEFISFAIRDLSDEDLELCRDVHSMHALDFLRLTYVPPNSVLELIITSSSLEKYDRIFKFLLVLLRMHAFSQNLMLAVARRGAECSPDKQHHRFCLHLHHFATNILDYALNVAINMPWEKMIQCFKAVHDSILMEDYDRCMSIAASISQLCKMHEDALNEILAALFLNKTQEKLFAATCEIFRIGLHFARDDTVNGFKHHAVHYEKLHQALNTWLVLARKSTNDGRSREFRIVDYLLVKFDHTRY